MQCINYYNESIKKSKFLLFYLLLLGHDIFSEFFSIFFKLDWIFIFIYPIATDFATPESKFGGPHMSLLVMLKLIWNILSLHNLFKAYW